LKEPHTKADWARIGKGGDLHDHLDEVLEQRRIAREKAFDEAGVSLADRQFYCG
jgi:hypothetical protein